MKKLNTSPISGMQELLPNLQSEFNRLKSGIAAAFAKHGFRHIETPTIERNEILLAKAGGDTEKQIYKVVKTAEASDDADQALRFDHTVPLSRYVVEHANDLTFPFKVTQTGRNFRGERAQKGRFREFYQCDVDVIGWQTLPIAYDADVISTLMDALLVLPFPQVVMRVSNRKLLSGLLQALDLTNKSTEIFSIIDHAEKVPAETTKAALAELGLSDENVVKITTFMQIRGSREDAVAQLRALNITDPVFLEGVDELDQVLTLLEPKTSERIAAIADTMIVRGLDYYTGTVFEAIAPDYREIGSICGGGRYENLAQNYTDQALPGVGGSIGLTRLFHVLSERGLVQASTAKPVDICLVPISPSEYLPAEQLAEQLRQQDKSVDINLTDKKLGDKLKYASKIANSAIIIGEDEVRNGKFTIKNLETGAQSELEITL